MPHAMMITFCFVSMYYAKHGLCAAVQWQSYVLGLLVVTFSVLNRNVKEILDFSHVHCVCYCSCRSSVNIFQPGEYKINYRILSTRSIVFGLNVIQFGSDPWEIKYLLNRQSGAILQRCLYKIIKKKNLCKITDLCTVFNGLLHLMWCVGQIWFSNFCPSHSSVREGNMEEPGQRVKQQERCRGAATAMLGTDRGWAAQQELFGKKCEQCNE